MRALSVLSSSFLAVGLSVGIPRPVTGQQSSPIQHLLVTVASTNDEWTETGVMVAKGDLIVIIAPGTIRIGPNIGDVDATGAQPGGGTSTGSGILQFKIGTSAGRPTGRMGTIVAQESGALKLRVQDNRYEDNSGAFEVHVIIVPASALPEPKRVP